MKATIAMRCDINLMHYRMKYGNLIAPQLMDVLIALDYIHKIELPKKEVLKVNAEYLEKKSELSKCYKLYNFIADTINSHYGGDPEFVRIDAKNSILPVRFILHELAFCDYIKVHEIDKLVNKVFQYDNPSRSKIMLALILHPLDTICLLEMDLEPTLLMNYLDELKNYRTVEDDVKSSKEFISYFLYGE